MRNNKEITLDDLRNGEYEIIDIRSKQAYIGIHIANSININQKESIEKYAKNNPDKKYALSCFSATKSKALAHQINLDNVYFLNANLLQIAEYGLQIIESSSDFTAKLLKTKQDIYEKYLANKKAWIVAFSGGKDSTCVLQLMYDMLCKMSSNELNPTYAIVSNTLVEAPNVENYLHKIVTAIKLDANMRKIPFEIIMVSPDPQDQFWVNLIGKGYPSPTRTFRWCTERLKINPTYKIVKQIIKKHSEAILMLGVRTSESQNRKNSIQKRIRNEAGFSNHDNYPNTLIYSPITDWTTDDVWTYLSTHNPSPWGISHNELFDLYAKASNDECQFIIDKSQNSCGGSRFGCWVCTLVDEDKSMQGFIKNGENNLKPLNEFRDFIKQARENPDMRNDFGRDNKFRLGPFTSETRKEILHRLLSAEMEFKKDGGSNLISDSQIKLIAKEWSKEFDSENSAIKIAKEYDRMKDFSEIIEEKLPDEEIIDNINSEYANMAKAIIKEAISISNNGAKSSDIIEIIRKNIKNESAKIKE